MDQAERDRQMGARRRLYGRVRRGEYRVIGVEVPIAWHHALKVQASLRGRTLAEEMRRAIEAYLRGAHEAARDVA